MKTPSSRSSDAEWLQQPASLFDYSDLVPGPFLGEHLGVLCHLVRERLETCDYTELHPTLASLRASTITHLVECREACPTITNFRQLQSITNAVREALRLLPLLITTQGWQSPTFSHSVFSQEGREALQATQSGAVCQETHQLSESYELDYLALYDLRHFDGVRASWHAGAFLTNSGASALHTAAYCATLLRNNHQKLLVDSRSYPECQQLLLDLFQERALVADVGQWTALSDHLQDGSVGVIFIDSLASRDTKLGPSFATILHMLNSTTNPCVLVIDNTCLSTAFDMAAVRRGLNKNIELIVHESTLKHLQYGLDLVTAGIVTAIGSKELPLALGTARSRCGSTISDMAVGALPPLYAPLLHARCNKFHRNLSYFMQQLRHILAFSGLEDQVRLVPPPEEVVFITPGVNSFQGCCCHIEFAATILRTQDLHRCIELILEQAQSFGIPLHAGASFGFGITRLGIPATRLSTINRQLKEAGQDGTTHHLGPRIRVSCGLEEEATLRGLAVAISEGLKRFFAECRTRFGRVYE